MGVASRRTRYRNVYSWLTTGAFTLEELSGFVELIRLQKTGVIQPTVKGLAVVDLLGAIHRDSPPRGVRMLVEGLIARCGDSDGAVQTLRRIAAGER